MRRAGRILGRTRRQRRIRVGGIVVLLIEIAMIALLGVIEIEGRPLFAAYYLPALFVLPFVWLILVVLDVREGLKEISEREGSEFTTSEEER